MSAYIFLSHFYTHRVCSDDRMARHGMKIKSMVVSVTPLGPLALAMVRPKNQNGLVLTAHYVSPSYIILLLVPLE